MSNHNTQIIDDAFLDKFGFMWTVAVSPDRTAIITRTVEREGYPTVEIERHTYTAEQSPPAHGFLEDTWLRMTSIIDWMRREQQIVALSRLAQIDAP